MTARGRGDPLRTPPARQLLAAVVLTAALVLAPQASASHSQLTLISDPNGTNGRFNAAYVGPKGGNASFFYDIPDGRNWWAVPVSDGSHAFYASDERLVAGDSDAVSDWYDFSWGQGFEWVTQVPYERQGGSYCWPLDPYEAYGSCPLAASVDGRHVFFKSIEQLVPEDTDAYADLYERFGGVMRLVSTGPAGGNGPYPYCGGGSPCRDFFISLDGERVFFETREPLVPEDTDGGCTFRHDAPCVDIYERSNGTTKLVSTGPNDGHGAHDACAAVFCTFRHPFPVSIDGDHVYFLTDDRLVPDDIDSSRDLYDRANGTTRLISTGPNGGNGGFDVEWTGASAGGERVFFRTQEALVSEDSNGQVDVYEHSDGATTIVPSGPLANPYAGSGLNFLGPSYDGSRIFYSTRDRLVSADTDDSWDLYARTGEAVELISTGPAGGNGAFDVCGLGAFADPCIEGASRDGSRVYFTTREPLVSEDTDNQCELQVGVPAPCIDIYERSNGTTKLVSTGPVGDAAGANFDGLHSEGVSADGSRIFFTTHLSLVSEDTDGGKTDIYERGGGETTLISAGPEPLRDGVLPTFGGMSADGRVVFFSTGQPLVPADTDNCSYDAYMRLCTDVYAARVAPDCSGVTSMPRALRPADHKFRRIALRVTGGGTDSLAIEVTSVTQDEPVVGKADSTSPDARIAPMPGAVLLRAERNPKGDGRVYRVSFQGTDRFGGACTGSVAVSVPRHEHGAAVDSAPPSYDSFGP